MSRDKSQNSNIDLNTIGGRIKYIRLRFNETQQKFSDKICIARSNLSQIENGVYEPSYNVLKNIVMNYDIDSCWLLTGEGEMTREGDGSGFKEEGRIYETEDDALEMAISDLRAKYSEDEDRDRFILAVINIIKMLLENK